ncbi:DeoR family transcriptional regulator [Actinomadura sp. NBRC 104425]|uniref:DeoR/GlpR family DNA-binding transcription regulator n=1 Tax=Actinomadura sp. NBRC 104425 TaxID=3032204 RepID=UPI00249F9968|nr:DeoR/GlpR family DNA-binding transcription regulator [Actinomadura sp. NBRC 104425]GLZ13918.1 DeoR family transcriptional regulator [Actinomadura sp. NBRC 104425]
MSPDPSAGTDTGAGAGARDGAAGAGERLRAAERRRLIEELVAARGNVAVEELAASLGVTQSTIRRDLALLTERGRLARTYGGAMPVTAAPEPPVGQRAHEHVAEKDRIARWAAAQIGDGESVLLDAGTTTGRVAHHLRSRTGLTVITNGLTAVTELADATEIDLVVLGGSLRHISQGLVGPLAELTLSRLTADRAFLGADGLDAALGICEASLVQTRLKEQMAERAREVYVLADASKLGRAPFGAWAALPGPWTLVTDHTADEERLAPFRALPHVRVVRA